MTSLPMAGPPVPRRSGPIADLLDLVLPATCAACHLPGPVLCADCARGWQGPPRRREQDAGRLDRLDGAGPLPVWARAVYQGAVRRTVLAWKDHGRLELTRWFAALIADAARSIAAELRALIAGPTRPRTDAEPCPLVVVPAPPSTAGRRRRGEDLLRPLALAAAAALVDLGVPAVAWPCLRTRPTGRDQVGLGNRARARNAAERVDFRRRPPPLPGAPGLADLPGPRAAEIRSPASHPVLLLDDVLTTGATLAACRARLDSAGHRVVAAVVLAATPRRTHSRHGLEPGAAPG